MTQIILTKKNKSWKTSNLKDFLFKSYKATVIQASVVLAQNKQQSTEQVPETKPLIFGQLIFDRNPKAFQWKQNSLFKMNEIGSSWISTYAKNDVGPHSPFF